MNKIFLKLAFLLVVSNCSNLVLKPEQKKVTVFTVDYKRYAEKGFLMTPYSYTAPHDSYGEVRIELTPAIIAAAGNEVNPKYAYVYQNGLRFAVEEVSLQEALDSAYVYCLRYGANAFVNIRYESEFTHFDYANLTGDKWALRKYTVSGFAIKRKD
jgi:hypothetical protein